MTRELDEGETAFRKGAAVNGQERHSTDGGNDLKWLYLLAGYVVAFAAARVLSRHGTIGERAEAFLGGLGVALSGRSLGSPWRL